MLYYIIIEFPGRLNPLGYPDRNARTEIPGQKYPDKIPGQNTQCKMDARYILHPSCIPPG